MFALEDDKIDEALAILISMNLLQIVDGLARFDFASVMTKWDFDRFEIKTHHTANLRYALESVGWPIDQRFLSSVTIPCNQALYEELVKNIRQIALDTLERSNKVVVSPEDCDKVVTLQFALFPFFNFHK